MFTDELRIGDILSELEFVATPQMNKQVCKSLHCNNPIYSKLVHPALLIGMSNITKSPSFSLKDGVAAVHTNDEIEFVSPAMVGETIKVNWVVTYIFRRRDKNWDDKEYQVVEAVITDNRGIILKRRMTDYFARG